MHYKKLRGSSTAFIFHEVEIINLFMDAITNVWNNFCKSIRAGQKNNQKEISFEKSTMTKILNLLGWSRFKENVIEQKKMDNSMLY